MLPDFDLGAIGGEPSGDPGGTESVPQAEPTLKRTEYRRGHHLPPPTAEKPTNEPAEEARLYPDETWWADIRRRPRIERGGKRQASKTNPMIPIC